MTKAAHIDLFLRAVLAGACIIGMWGDFESINAGPAEARAAGATMIGTGLTPEGIWQNAVAFDLMNENSYRCAHYNDFHNTAPPLAARSRGLRTQLRFASDCGLKSFASNCGLKVATAIMKCAVGSSAGVQLSPSRGGWAGTPIVAMARKSQPQRSS